jgi:hypothetical protein
MTKGQIGLRRIVQTLMPRVHVGAEEVLLDGTTSLTVDIAPEPTELRVRWIGNGWPQDVREALADLAIADNEAWPRNLVVVAKRLSSGSIKLLEERNANWADEGGNAEILAPGVIVSRRGSQPKAAERTIAWSESALDVAELLLSRQWPEGFGTTELADWTGWSSPRVSQLLSTFDRRGWTVKQGPTRGRGARRELVDAGGLLEEWSRGVNEGEDPIVREASRTISDIGAFLRQDLAPALSQNLSWALGGWAASEELAPYLTTVPTLQIYVHDDDLWEPLDNTLRAAGLKEVSEGGRVQFKRASSNVLERASSASGMSVVSAPRVYADLLRLGPRGEEAAEHLKETVVDPFHRRQRQGDPPDQMLAWERSVRERLSERIASNPRRDQVSDLYRHGTYSTSYIFKGGEAFESLPKFRRKLRGAVGGETGWPAWQLAEGTEQRARPVDAGIECWFDDTIFEDSAHSDFWRAEPTGKLSLIRGYDEDGEHSKLKPGTGIDLTLPVWRIAECLRHAGRLAASMNADRINFMVRWEGLQGRILQNYANNRRSLVGRYECAQSSVTSYIEFSAVETEPHLVSLTEALVAPLFEAFDFFEAPPDLFEDEVERMRGRTQ